METLYVILLILLIVHVLLFIYIKFHKELQDKVGIHLNLTWGIPLTDDIKRDPLFCNRDGEFSASFHQRKTSRFWIPTSSKCAVAKEIRAQIDAFDKSGFAWRHIDSHHHVHMDLSILPIVLALAKEREFSSVRIGRNIGQGMSLFNRTYKAIANRKVVKSDLAYTDYFGSPFDAESSLDSIGPDSSVELMVHPIFRLGDERSMQGSLRDYMLPIEDAEGAIARVRARDLIDV